VRVNSDYRKRCDSDARGVAIVGPRWSRALPLDRFTQHSHVVDDEMGHPCTLALWLRRSLCIYAVVWFHDSQYCCSPP
jgi:hypothetical protein